jgi:Fe-S-cluster containining protein
MATYECDRCGACCREIIVEVQELDVVREPRLAAVAELMDGRGKVEFESHWERTYLLACGHTHPCPLLGPDNLCGVYPTRPNVCVAFEAGTDLCQQARGMAGLSPLAPTCSEGAERRGDGTS